MEQLLPHLLLAAAQVGHVADVHVWHREERAAKGDQLVESGGDRSAEAEIVAEVDDAVAGLEALLDRGVQLGQFLRFAMNGADGPDTSAAADRHEPCVGGASPLGRGEAGSYAARRTSSSLFAACSVSVFSTAANSRASRSSAASYIWRSL